MLKCKHTIQSVIYFFIFQFFSFFISKNTSAFAEVFLLVILIFRNFYE